MRSGIAVLMALAAAWSTVLGDKPTDGLTKTNPRDKGYEQLSGQGWYKLHGNKMTWHQAVKVCESEGSYLAVLNSNDEARAVKSMMDRHREVDYGVCGCAFLGFHDLSREGNFVTVLGEPLEETGFVKWGPNNPSNTGSNEDCGSITFRGDLNDLSCVEPYPFICEHPSVPTTIRSGTVDTLHPMYVKYPYLGSYKLHTDRKTWNDAKSTCDQEGAYLAIVNSEEESDVFRKMIGRNPDLELGAGQTAFIGMYEADDGNFITVFGESVSTSGFDDWAPNSRGSNSQNLNCGGFTRSGQLSAAPCLETAPFFCERYEEDEQNLPVPSIPDPAAAGGYTVFPGVGAYKLHLDATTWHEAKRNCEAENAYLAIINSLTESQTLRDMVGDPKVNMKNYWSILLGFHDLSTEGHFITVFNETLESTGFTQWFGSNPDNYGPGEDCGAMKRDGLLNDVSCTLRLPYFCERNIGLDQTKTSSEMRIFPEHVHVRQGSLVSIMCQSDEPLIECHFKMQNNPMFDLSLGEASRADPAHLTSDISMYRYNGTGLQNGQCGVVISLSPGIQRKIVGCRGRGRRGGWKYGYMSLQASNAGALDKASVPPKLFFASETEDIHLLWQTPDPVSSCKFILPGRWSETVFTERTAQSGSYEDSDENGIFLGGYRPEVRTGTDPTYFGQGFAHGDCGISLPKSSQWNGLLWCGFGNSEGFDWRAVSIIIPKAPEPPVLRINAREHSEGAILEAECVVGGGRPVADITWYLDNDVIRQDREDDSPTDSWAWPYDQQIITQKLTRQLRTEDNGKELICEANHVSFPDGPVRASKTITIERNVFNRTFDVDEFGFEVGKQGFISVVVQASPKPVLTWHFDDVIIQEGGQDPTGRFFAAQAVQTNSLAINWIAKLIISNVTEADLKREFYVTARNYFGAQGYKIHIFKGPKSTKGGQSDIETLTRAPTTTTTTTTRSRWVTTTTTPRTTTTTSMRPTTTTARTTTRTSTTTRSTSTSTSSPSTTVVVPPGNVAQTTLREVMTTVGVTDGQPVDEPSTVNTLVKESQRDVLQSQAKANDSLSAGAIFGIVVAILVLHLSLAAILVFGRRVGWWCIPGKTRVSGLIRPTLSMDNLVNEEDCNH